MGWTMPPRSPFPRNTEFSSTSAYNGAAFQSLGLPQVEEATEFQPLYSAQNGSFYDGGALPPLPSPQSRRSSVPTLPASYSSLEQQQQQQHFLPTSLLELPSSQSRRSSVTSLSASYSSLEQQQQHFLPPSQLELPSSQSRRSSMPALPAGYSTLEQQQHFLPPFLLEYQDGDFDNEIAQEISSSMFQSPAMSTEPWERENLRQPLNSCPARPNLSVGGTPPSSLSTAAPLSRPKRGGALREPFTAMAVTDKPKFSPDKRKLCCVEGCLSQARAFNRCKRHGGSKRCSSPGCTKSVQSRGLCIRHGGGSRCQESGCTRASQSHGRCKLHGGGRPCIVAGCDKKAHLKRLCRKHGGGIKCRVVNCEKWSQRQGMCMTHSKVAGGPQPSGSFVDSDQFGQNSLSLPAFSASSSPLSLSTFSDAA
uniref:WRKY19-like zinc finger domain-containing protein n=1 Tax=Peronospora matthiolae TaxID=2874970 RepID=A0AAV1US44_9STRA